jgi:hypothetical protein
MNKDGLLTNKEIDKLVQIGRSYQSALDYGLKHNPKEKHADVIKRVKGIAKRESSICSICGRLGAYHNYQMMPWSDENGRQEHKLFCERNIRDRRVSRVLTPNFAKTEYAQALMVLKTGINIGD